MVQHIPVKIKLDGSKLDLLTFTNDRPGTNLTDSIIDLNYGHSHVIAKDDFIVKHQICTNYIWGSIFEGRRLVAKLVICQESGIITQESIHDAYRGREITIIVTRGSANAGEFQKYLPPKEL